MTKDQHIAVRLVISGRVQGVWFRNWMVDEARARGLDGWVRNRRDGSVEALVSGPAGAVRESIEACHEGPPMARVDMVEQHSASVAEAGSGFVQRSSA